MRDNDDTKQPKDESELDDENVADLGLDDEAASQVAGGKPTATVNPTQDGGHTY